MDNKAIHVVTWGATMFLADFFEIIPVCGTEKSVAVRFEKEEWEEFGSEKCLPKQSFRRECYPVRIKEGKIEIKFPSKWTQAEVWDGKAVSINTYD